MEIRRSYDCLISTIGFPILVRHLYIELGPSVPSQSSLMRVARHAVLVLCGQSVAMDNNHMQM